MAGLGGERMRAPAQRAHQVIRVDAAWLAVEPLDMRAGVDTALARVVNVFGCVIHAMSVHGFTACRSSISRHAGHRFHAMSVHRFTACRSSS
jgi:hypothetical protein